MPFRGWPAEAFDFFEGLEADNTKAYWNDHRDIYLEQIRGPLEALFDEVADEFGPGRVFRPYRDVRFSADKSPYKTNVAGSASDATGSVFYASLWSEGLMSASGYYQPARDQLERYRRAVDSPAGGGLERIVASLEDAGYDIGGEALKRSPRGFPADHPRARLLRFKGVTVGRRWKPAAWMGTRKAKDRIVEVWRAAAPLNAWLHDHVGPTEEPADRR
jgi:uncharacterized protein (TIGR02453 family)